MENILDSYIELTAKVSDLNKSQAVERLAGATGRKISLQLFNSWQRGDVSLPRPVYESLLRVVVVGTANMPLDYKMCALSFPKISGLRKTRNLKARHSSDADNTLQGLGS